MQDMNHESIRKAGPYSALSIEGMDKGLLNRLYYFMLRLRRVELALIAEYHPADEMRCPVHFCVGQEAVSAALSVLLRPEDYMYSHHRTHGFYLAKSAPLRGLFAEIYGKATGANGGKAGSQDISCGDVNFYSGAILSGAMGLAVGTAYGLRYKDSKSVAVTGFGEGATDEGIYWEAINYAALHRLPVLFMCENNRYATYSPQNHRQLKDNLTDKVASFGVKSCSIFGNDVVAVHQTIDKALKSIREGEGPQFIQAYTYRWNSHVGPEDDGANNYRLQGELDFWKQNCPVVLLEEKLLAAGILTPASKEQMTVQIDAEIKDAFDFAKSSPFPKNADWAALNYCQETPLADKLLEDAEHHAFDQNQAESVPGPY